MHPVLAGEIIKVCRARSKEGDCPITPAESIERLEQCIIELASQLEILSTDEPSIEAYKLFRKERQHRERLCEALNKLAAEFETASNKCTYAAEAQRLSNCAKFCRDAVNARPPFEINEFWTEREGYAVQDQKPKSP